MELAGEWEVIAVGPGSPASLKEGVCVCVTTSVCYHVSVAIL